jgi:hypothetical protein
MKDESEVVKATLPFDISLQKYIVYPECNLDKNAIVARRNLKNSNISTECQT